MADKRKVRKKKPGPKSSTTLAKKSSDAPVTDDEKSSGQYGGMDLSNFKKNLGCGG